MHVIAVLNQKGGSGKTTIATHLARSLKLDGESVLLVDSDPQGSARDWAAVRKAQPVTVVGIDRPTAELVDLVKQRIELSDDRLQAAFVVSRAIKGTRIGGGSGRRPGRLRPAGTGGAHHPAHQLPEHCGSRHDRT